MATTERTKNPGPSIHQTEPISNYIVDFYCPRLGLAIEIDGISHDEKLEHDKRRQAEIEKQGVQILRFQERDVRKNISGVISVIEAWIDGFERNHCSDR